MGFIAFSHVFIAISGRDRNLLARHNAQSFLIGPMGSLSSQNHRQSHTTLHICVETESHTNVLKEAI